MDATTTVHEWNDERPQQKRRRWLDNWREDDPTPEQIAERAAEVRSQWSEEEHRIRWRFR